MPRPHSSIPLPPLSPHTYLSTTPPTHSQLLHAHRLFTSTPPRSLFRIPSVHALPAASPVPEVLLLGRSNVGKSSALNALLGRPNAELAAVSRRPGRTRVMEGFGVGGVKVEWVAGRWDGGERKRLEIGYSGRSKGGGFGACILVDAPGYGFGSRDEWGKAVGEYLRKRKQLRRAFVLVDAEHGLKKHDVDIIRALHLAGTPFQIVLSKIDKIAPFRTPPRTDSSPSLHTASHPSHSRTSNDLESPSSKLTSPSSPPPTLAALVPALHASLRAAFPGQPLSVLADVLATSSARLAGAEDEVGAKFRLRCGIAGWRWAICQAAGLEGRVWAQQDVDILEDDGIGEERRWREGGHGER